MTNFAGFRVCNLRRINPIIGLRIFGIVNLLGRVNRGFEFFQEATSLVTLAIDEYIKSIIRAKMYVRS